MKMKLFASDLDGTLLNEKHIISQQSADVIRTAQQTGKVFLAVTGRAWGTVYPLLKEAGVSCGAVLLNGAEYRTEDGKIVFQEHIKESAVSRILRILLEYGIDFEINTSCGDFSTNTGVCQTARVFSKEKVFGEKGTEVQKFFIFSSEMPMLIRVKERLEHIKEINITSSDPHNIEITANNATKDKMLAKVAKSLGIQENEIAVFGDGENDKTMLKRFYHSHAMENSHDSVKHCARYIIGTNKENSVAKQIEKIMEEEKNVIF